MSWVFDNFGVELSLDTSKKTDTGYLFSLMYARAFLFKKEES